MTVVAGGMAVAVGAPGQVVKVLMPSILVIEDEAALRQVFVRMLTGDPNDPEHGAPIELRIPRRRV